MNNLIAPATISSDNDQVLNDEDIEPEDIVKHLMMMNAVPGNEQREEIMMLDPDQQLRFNVRMSEIEEAKTSRSNPSRLKHSSKDSIASSLRPNKENILRLSHGRR